MIIDMHAHAIRPCRMVPAGGTSQMLLAVMDTARVDKAVIISHETKDYLVPPENFVGTVPLHPTVPPLYRSDLQFKPNRGLPVDSCKWWPQVRRAAELPRRSRRGCS